jgi:hypothetical protein
MNNNDDLWIGLAVGVVCTILMCWLLVDKMADAQTPQTWCESIAEASKTEPYKVVYDRCYAEYQERKGQ